MSLAATVKRNVGMTPPAQAMAGAARRVSACALARLIRQAATCVAWQHLAACAKTTARRTPRAMGAAGAMARARAHALKDFKDRSAMTVLSITMASRAVITSVGGIQPARRMGAAQVPARAIASEALLDRPVTLASQISSELTAR